MSETITISPVSRVEGHGKITIQLDDNKQVEQSHFHVVEFRGFELFCQGRLLSEMPVIMPRICGICPVSHHLAAAKACDAVLGIDIPPAAKKLRELMHMGQMIHSHSLHFFHLASPDFILGPSADPAIRNVVGLAQADRALVEKAIKLRKYGQLIVERIGGRPIHPATAIPGGMSRPLSHDARHELIQGISEAMQIAELALSVGGKVLADYADVVSKFAVIDTSYMGTVRDGALELYDGDLRVIDAEGKRLVEFAPSAYLEHLGEHVEDWSYLKFPFLRSKGYPEGTYRVGPLGRLNVADSVPTPAAAEHFKAFKALGAGRPVRETMNYHYARLIELLYAVERAGQLLADEEIVSSEVRVPMVRTAGEGVGVIEAPRGTLIHHYWANDEGFIEKVNLVVATVHNNPAMDASVNAVAKEFIKGGEITEGTLNMLEMAIRCYDPCLSCATHAAGQMQLRVEVLDAGGNVVSVVERRTA